MHERPPGPLRWERCAKPGGGTRWIVRLGSGDDLAYRRLVAPLAPSIGRSLGPIAFANRARGGARLEPWRPARRAWRRAVSSAVGANRVVVASDVRDCYGSIGERALGALAIDPELDRFLRGLRSAGVRGLPVGPDPSAILANAVLAIADREAAAAGCRPIRWVDDVVFAAAGRRTVGRAFDAWRRALEGLGLEAHDGKTRWLLGPGTDGLVLRGSGSGSGSAAHAIIRAS
jgi:hypothetical protein